MKLTVQPRRTAVLGQRILRQSGVLAATFCAFLMPAFAQDSQTVTLKYDDGEDISGELVEYNDQVIVLQGSVGLITVPVAGVMCIGQACPDALRFFSTAPELMFTTSDGSVKVTGQLIEVANNQYVIATNLGELRMNVAGAICAGDGCPEVDGAAAVALTNGATVIEGKLIGFEDAAYIVDVPNMGTIRVDSAVFDCAGASCP